MAESELAAFRRQRKLLQHLSTKDNERNLYQNLLTIENTDSDLKVHALHYANELLKNFCRLANANKRSNKQNTLPFFACHWIRIASIVFCFVLQRTPTNENNGGTEWQGIQQLLPNYSDYIHSQREIVFDPEKLTLSISSEHTTTCKSPGSYSLPYSLPSLWKFCKRISPNSPFWSGNLTTSTREPPTRAWIRANIWRQDGAICS